MNETAKWRESGVPARLEERLPDGAVRCHLSPRRCLIRAGSQGFCGVRVNRGGRLVSLNYGKSVHATEETIETEAVYHFAPGERILSMGNIGCMLNCAYCHNWRTSQAKLVADRDVHPYTPQQVVETALRHGIRVLSWTYNDPVVWHEFVRDTAMLAHEAGLLNLYKSAFFITPEAVEELLPHLDVFSISVKSMDPEYYRRITKGQLQPVLDATRQVHAAGKHVEVSTLMITDLSDDERTARQVAEWVMAELDPNVPLHFVRFHPDYRMRDTIRTPVDRLVRAREIALAAGVRHVYLGNVYDTPFTDTSCRSCGALLISRYGLRAHATGLAADGRCVACGTDAGVRMLAPAPSLPMVGATRDAMDGQAFDWHDDVHSIHVFARNESEQPRRVYVRARLRDGTECAWRVIHLLPRESYRFIVARSAREERGCEVAAPDGVRTTLHEVLDRAHFPTDPVPVVGLDSEATRPVRSESAHLAGIGG